LKIVKKENSSTPTDNNIYGIPANQFSPSAGTTLLQAIEAASHSPAIQQVKGSTTLGNPVTFLSLEFVCE